MSDTGELMAKLGLDKSEFVASLKDIGNDVGELKRGLAELGLALGAGEALHLFQEMAERAEDLRNTARALGLNSEELQSLNYIARETGLGEDGMARALLRVNVAADAASNAHSTQARALTALGISTEQFQSLDPAGRLELLAKAAHSSTDEHKAFAAVTEILGAKLAPWATTALEELADKGLGGVEAAARSAGQVMSEETIAKAAELNEKVMELVTMAKNSATWLVGTFVEIGQGLGIVAAKVVNTVQGIETSYDGMADRATKVVEKQEKIIAAVAATKAQTDSLAAAQQKYAERKMSDDEKIEVHLQNAMGYMNAIGHAEAGSADSVAAKLGLLKEQNAMLDITSRQEAEAAKNQETWAKSVAALWDRQNKAAFDALTTEQKIAVVTKQIAADKAAIAQADEGSNAWIAASNKLLDDQATLEKLVGEAAKATTAQYNAQAGGIERIVSGVEAVQELGRTAGTDAYIKNFGGVDIGKPKTAADLANVSDDVLAALVGQDQAKIAKLEAGKATAGIAEAATNFAGRSIAESMVQMEIAAAQQLLTQRAGLRAGTITPANYGGDLTTFDAALASANGTAPAPNAQLSAINAALQTISAKLPNLTATPVPVTVTN